MTQSKRFGQIIPQTMIICGMKMNIKQQYHYCEKSQACVF
jgi:hypothetical protein